jgi:hypothetical protein
MATTLPGDFAFEPKVWQDHISAYFDRKMALGQLAMVERTLTQEPGTTINFPYFKAIGDAEEPAADASLSVDKMQDDSFSSTVREVAKAVAIRKSALMKSATSSERIFAEVQEQLARVHAEKVDKDLIAEINTTGNHIQGYSSVGTGDLMDIRKVLEAKVIGFGDKQDQAVAMAMHSLHFLDLMRDSTAGFLKADANDPFWQAPGFQGRLLGMALFVLDSMPLGTAISGKRVHQAFIMKANPYGLIVKEEPMVERDYDILHREHVVTATQWYAVKAFHAKVASLDLRIARMSVVTQANV